MKARFEVFGRRAAGISVDLDLFELARSVSSNRSRNARTRVFSSSIVVRASSAAFPRPTIDGDVVGPGPPAAFLRATDEQRLEARLAIDVKRADAFRSMQFVPGEGKKMNRQFRQIDRHFPDRLDRIGVKKNAFAATKRGDFLEWKNHAGFVVRPHHRDDRGVRPDGAFHLFQIEMTLFVDRDDGRPRSRA